MGGECWFSRIPEAPLLFLVHVLLRSYLMKCLYSCKSHALPGGIQVRGLSRCFRIVHTLGR